MEVKSLVKPTSPSQEIVLEFFRRLGDWPRLADLFAEDATWTIWGALPLSGTYEGRDAVIYGFHVEAAKLFDAAGPAQMTIKNLLGTGLVVAAEFEYESPTAIGKQYHNHYVEVFEVRNGAIQHVREYMDTQHLYTACVKL